jgi:GT2 family glycosyltransferase
MRFPLASRLRWKLRGRPQAPATPPIVTPADVTIVVLNWNRRDDTLECLESLAAADLGGASILVVDNGSRDGSAAAVRPAHPGVDVLELPRNEGYAGGNNAGIRRALESAAGAVLLLNNDTRVAPDFLGWLVNLLNIAPRAAAVSSAILRMDSPEVLYEAFLELYFGHGLVRRRGMNALPGEGYDEVRTIDAGAGCSLLLRADALRTVGLLDDAFFAYHEEIDWCFRAHRAGYLVYYEPRSRVYHHGSRSTGQRLKTPRHVPRDEGLPNPLPVAWNPVRIYLGARNAVRFVRKNGGIEQRLHFVLSTLYAVPLEFLAAVMDREDDNAIGAWSYRRALGLYCLHRNGDPAAAGREPDRGSRLLRLLAAPVALLWSLPRDAWRAHCAGHTAEIEAHVRGLWDGLRNAPLPLAQLGLR